MNNQNILFVSKGTNVFKKSNKGRGSSGRINLLNDISTDRFIFLDFDQINLIDSNEFLDWKGQGKIIRFSKPKDFYFDFYYYVLESSCSFVTSSESSDIPKRNMKRNFSPEFKEHNFNDLEDLKRLRTHRSNFIIRLKKERESKRPSDNDIKKIITKIEECNDKILILLKKLGLTDHFNWYERSKQDFT